MDGKLLKIGQETFEIVKMVGDGNCLFRALSFSIWGTQEHHARLRREIVDYVGKFWKEYYETIQEQYEDGEFDTLEKYKSKMGDWRKGVYGNEFEILVFCTIYRKNAKVYWQNTVQPFDIEISPKINDYVHLLFSGIHGIKSSRGHYDILLKRNLDRTSEKTTEPLVSQDKLFEERAPKCDVVSTSSSETTKDELFVGSPIGPEDRGKSTTDNEKSPSNKNRTKEDVCKMFKTLLINNGYENKRFECSRSNLQKFALEIYGDDSNKYATILRRMYQNDFMNVRSLTQNSSPETNSCEKSGKDNMVNTFARIICEVLGQNVTKTHVLVNKNVVSQTISKEYYLHNGWSVRNIKNLKKFGQHFNKFVSYLKGSQVDYINELVGKIDEEVIFNSKGNEVLEVSNVGSIEKKVNEDVLKENKCIVENIDTSNMGCEVLKVTSATLLSDPKTVENIPNPVCVNENESLIENKVSEDVFCEPNEVNLEVEMANATSNNGLTDSLASNDDISNDEKTVENISNQVCVYENDGSIENKANKDDDFTDISKKITKKAMISKNRKSKNVFEKYAKYEGLLTCEEHGLVNNYDCEDVKENIRGWIRKEIITQLSITCRINFSQTKRLKNKVMFMIGKCCSNEDDDCKDYKFIIKKIDSVLQIQVCSRGPTEAVHKGIHQAYQLRGKERKEYREVLKKYDCKTKQIADIKNLNEKARIDLNMQCVRTLQTLRKCRSEAIKEDDLHSDDLIDLILAGKMENEIPEKEKYIRRIEASPLAVHLYSKPQIDVLMSKDILVAYLDATGSIVRNVTLSQEKRIYYYAMVVNVNSEILPILEMFSERHDIPTIQNLLNTYKYHVLKRNKTKWPLIKRVVCDWSWALIIGVVGAWNNMDLLQYLNICYKLSNNTADKETYKHIVTVHCCCAHFMKMISDRLAKQNVKNKDERHFIMGAMAAMVKCDTLSKIENLFTSLAMVLLSEQLYSVTLECITVVSQVINDVGYENVNTDESISVEENEDYIFGRTKIDSPFNKRCNEIVMRLKEDLVELEIESESGMELNKFYCPTFFDYLLRNLMPLVPMWTGMMIGLHPVSEEMRGRFSNSNVENHFRQVKHRLLNGQTNMKIGRVIRILRKNVNDTLENVRINIAEYNKGKRRKKNKKARCTEFVEDYIQERLNEEQFMDDLFQPISDLVNEIKDSSNSDEKKIDFISEIDEKKVSSSLADVSIRNGKMTFQEQDEIMYEGCLSSENITQVVGIEVEEDIDDPSIEEKWAKKRKSSINFFENKIDIGPHKCRKLSFLQSEVDDNGSTHVSIKPVEENTDEHAMSGVEHDDTNTKTYENERNHFRVSWIKEYPHKEAMSNGLFLNPKYYLPLDEKDEHEVALYINVVPTRVLHLNAHDYASLGAGKWLRQGAVDASIISIIRELKLEDKVKFVNTGTTQSLFRNNSLTIACSTWSYFKKLRNYDYLIMPYIVAGNHYCIIICDLKKRICMFYNSLPNYKDDFTTGVQKFRQFWSKLQTTENDVEECRGNDWTYNHVKEPIQQDLFNCGVYVSRFVECLLKRENFEQFDTVKYRDYLKKLCLKHSDSMCDVCLYCSKGSKRNNNTWVLCDNCKRWIHYKYCLDYLDVSESEVDSDGFKFECKRCSAYREKWNDQPWSCD